jgi:hypothetical protein
MLRYVANYFQSIPAVFIDGLLWVCVAWFAFNQSYFGSDEAAKYIAPLTRFWIQWVIGSGAVIAGAIKMFRSTSYADHQQAKDEARRISTGNTEIFAKTETVKTETTKVP